MSDRDPGRAPAGPATGVAVRFVVVADMPMIVLGVGTEPADDQLWTRLAMAGLMELPGFYGVDFPRGAKVGFTLTFEHLRLEDEDVNGLLQIPRASVGVDWLTAAQRLRGSMVAMGRNLELDPDVDDQAVCEELQACGAAGDLRGAIVGLAEPRTGLPLFF